MVIEKALEGLDGVQVATVSFKRKKADVSYDPTKVTVEDVVKTIHRLGFRAKPLGEER